MAESTPRRHRPDVSSLARWMPFELLVALRFLREGRMQSALILAGVTGGVAVIIFLTQLINQLQATIVDRVMGSQAHMVIRPLEEATQRVLAATRTRRVAAVVQPRAQRLRSVDQWEQVAELAAATPGVVAVSPVVSGPAFARRGGTSNKSVVIMGVQPEDYRRVVKMDSYMTQGRFDVTGHAHADGHRPGQGPGRDRGRQGARDQRHRPQRDAGPSAACLTWATATSTGAGCS